jgi:hypothetical protein
MMMEPGAGLITWKVRRPRRYLSPGDAPGKEHLLKMWRGTVEKAVLLYYVESTLLR